MASPTPPSLQAPPPLLKAIPERKLEEEDETNTLRQQEDDQNVEATAPPATATRIYKCRSTTPAAGERPVETAPEKTHPADGAVQVVSNKCRPSAREKISVVPLDAACGSHLRSRTSSFISSPGHNNLLKSFFSVFTWRSPRSPTCFSSSDARSHAALIREEEWRLVATELSRRLIHTTRKRDEALAEASRLKYSVAELEKKLAAVESYCRDLKSTLDCCDHKPHQYPAAAPVGRGEFPLELFLRAVSDSRSAVRHLTRSLAAQMRRDRNPPKVHDRLWQLLQQHDARAPVNGGGSGLLFYLEALLSRSFYEDFESAGYERGVSDRVLDPRARAEANMAAYAALRGLSWDDVLGRGTRHYSDSFSRFCDRKMGEVAASAPGGGCWGAWPEPLLRAFFETAKGVWLVHLIAWCGHPPVPVFRVDRGAAFDARYMEDVAAGGRQTLPAPATVGAAVKLMVAPGFYVQGSAVKCRVLCMSRNSGRSSSSGNDVGGGKVKVEHGRSDRSIYKIRRQHSS